jgi:glutamate-1-semialdehyde 2,1-aminomutase
MHKEAELKLTLQATEKALQVYKKAIDGNIKDYLVGKAIKPVFRKYN